MVEWRKNNFSHLHLIFLSLIFLSVLSAMLECGRRRGQEADRKMKGQERLDCESPLLFLLLFLQIIGFPFFCPSFFCQFFPQCWNVIEGRGKKLTEK